MLSYSYRPHHASYNTSCKPGPPIRKNIVKTTDDYVAFVALDWADKTHAFARHFVAMNKTETGTLDANPDAQRHSYLPAPCRGIIVTERTVLPQNGCYRREQLPAE